MSFLIKDYVDIIANAKIQKMCIDVSNLRKVTLRYE